jgi:O-antigen/teichoic acid export membrane protein
MHSFADRLLNLPKVLLRNGSHKQTILKNTVWLSIAEGVFAVANVFLAVYVIRVLGATEYGKFSIALSFVFLFSTLFDFGLSTAVTREFSLEPENQKHFSAIFTLKALFGVALTIVIAGLALLVTPDTIVRESIIVLCIYAFAMEGINLFYALFRARRQMEMEAGFRILQIVLLVLLVGVTMLFERSVLGLSLAYAASTVVTLVCIAVCFKWGSSISLRPVVDLGVWKKFLWIGFYLALAKGAGDVLTYTDSLVLGYFGMVTETGMYNAMLKINKLVLLPMTFVSGALFPTLIAILRESQEKFARYYRGWMKGTIFFSVCVVFVFLAEADRIILFVFPQDFLPAATALKLLTVMAMLVYINGVYYQVLLISGQQKAIFYVILSTSIINVTLNILLVPRLGINGAAIATVATYAVILCQYAFLIWRRTCVNPVEVTFVLTFGFAVISGLLMWWGISAMGGLNLLVLLFLAAGIYSLSFTGLNKIGRYLVPGVSLARG